jgi:hypothetical protein
MANFPDGTPRSSPSDMGSVGGVKDGRAERHADGTAPPPESIGWLNNVAGVVGGPNRASNPSVNIGPSSALWRKPAKGKFTTGSQKKR